MTNPSLDLVVITVSWNARSFIQDMLRTLYADLQNSGLKFTVYVVDNQSSDGTVDAVQELNLVPAVNIIESGGNLGFAAGNNVALRALGFKDVPAPNPEGPRTVFLLNTDTLTQPNAIRTLYDTLLKLPDAGCVGANLSYGDGAFQHGAFRFPGLMQILIDLFPLPKRVQGKLYDSGLNGRYARQLYDGTTPFLVDHTLGATMMLRREVIEQTGMFDEQFFMYCEEIDWSMRIHKAGWQIYNVPTAHITHLEGRSTGQIKPQSIVNLWTSRFKLYAKHYSGPKYALARSLVRLGMTLQIRKAKRMTIPADQREALIGAYRRVIGL